MQKTKKILKFCMLNFIFILTIFLITDYIYFKFIERNYRIECQKNNMGFDEAVRYKSFDIIDENDTSTTYVYKSFLEKKHYLEPIKPDNINNIQNSIILFGDSYTWMETIDGLQGQLAKYTNSIVFNFAFWGWGTQHMYYLTSKPLLYQIINENIREGGGEQPKYAIYTYIRDHKNRLYPIMDYFLDVKPNLTYNFSEDGKILEKKQYCFFNEIIFRSFMYRYLLKKFQKYDDKSEYLKIENLITESYKNLKKYYPNIKFIVLEYYQETDIISEEIQMFNNIEKQGIIHISTKELTNENLYDKKYTIEDGYHPNKHAWNLIVKSLAKKLESI